MLKLDAKTVAALTLAAGKNDVIHFDSLLPGYGYRLRRAANGKVLRSWVAQYRINGKQRRPLIGNADVVSAEAARIAARKILAKVQLGQDPQADRLERRAKDVFSFAKVTADYLADKQGKVRPRTHVEATRYLTGDYFKALHSSPLDKITRKDIAVCLVSIKADSGTVTAHAAKAALSAFFVWCMRMGYLEKNPTIGTEKFEANNRDRVLSDDELAAVWNASGGNDDYARIVRLLILTGCRRQEVGGMAWTELDADTGKWAIPAERSKNHCPHLVPLPAMAWDIFKGVKPQQGSDHLFGGSKGFQTWGRSKATLDGKLNGMTDWTLHDIRRTVATGMATLGVAPHIVEAVLNHQSGHKAGVAGVYNRASYEKEKRVALAQWTDHIRALASGTAKKIIPLRAVSS
jgi:integrase